MTSGEYLVHEVVLPANGYSEIKFARDKIIQAAYYNNDKFNVTKADEENIFSRVCIGKFKKKR
jgi:hypothetical protein